MCACLKTKHIIAGWKCCTCSLYNGLQRGECKGCGRVRCTPLAPDPESGEHFETYDEAYARDPKTLEAIREQLRMHDGREPS